MNLFNQATSIVESFDFEKALKVMNFLNWKWDGYENLTVDDLRSTAVQLLDVVISEFKKNPVANYASTGGFHAEIFVHPNQTSPTLSLMFYVEKTTK